MRILISESQFRYIITENALLEKIREKYVGEGKPVSEEKFHEITEVSANNTSYIIWMTKMIVDNIILSEDVYKFGGPKGYFTIFDKNKRHFPIKDINQIKTKELVSQFLRKVIEIREMSVDKTGSDVDESKKYVSVSDIKKLENVGINYLGSSLGYQVFEIPNGCKDDEEAYRAYKNILGKCTGRDQGANIDLCTMGSFEYFNDYLTKYSGSSYFVMYNLSDPQSPYQFHYESSQFMDKNDNQLLDG
jgi:hypothetical protein